MRVRDTFLKDLMEEQLPSLTDLEHYIYRLLHVDTDEDRQVHVVKELEDAQSYEMFVNILFDKLCKWLDFSLLERILEFFPNHINEARAQLESYKKKLIGVLQKKFDYAEAALKEAKVTEDTPPEKMSKIVVRYNLDAGGITLEDVANYRLSLSSILEIPHHLLVLVDVLYGSLLLELWIPEELTPRVVHRVEEVWRELWRRKVEGIEVGDRNFDLLQVEIYIHLQSELPATAVFA